MTFEYKMEEPNITESLEELQNYIKVLEENHKVNQQKMNQIKTTLVI